LMPLHLVFPSPCNELLAEEVISIFGWNELEI